MMGNLANMVEKSAMEAARTIVEKQAMEAARKTVTEAVKDLVAQSKTVNW
jgi:hypothetical protein